MTVFCVAATTLWAGDFDVSMGKIDWYDSERIPWMPSFLAKDLALDVPSGTDFTLSFDSGLFLELGAEFENADYALTPQSVVDAEAGLGLESLGVPIDPDLKGDNGYRRAADLSAADVAEIASTWVTQYDYLGLSWGLGYERDILVTLADGSRPLSASVDYRGEFVRNFLDEEILSEANAASDKRQLIFRSTEPDRRQYLLTILGGRIHWDRVVSLSHGLKDGYSADLYVDVAPGFVNPSIDPGITTSDGFSDQAIGGVNAAYYETGFGLKTNRYLFDLAPARDENLFSGYLETETTLRWFDGLGPNGRIPLAVREDYNRRFKAEAIAALKMFLPQWRFIETEWTHELKATYENEFAANPALTIYAADPASWDGEAYSDSVIDRIAVDAADLEYTTELKAVFYDFVELGLEVKINFAQTDTLGDAGATVRAVPKIELNVLFP